MSVTKNKFILGLLATSMMAGCSVSHETNRNVRAAANDGGSLLATAAQPMAPKDTRPVKVNDGVFVGTKSVRNENGDPLPSRFEGKSGITIVRTSSVGLREIAGAITEYTKIPVVLAASPAAGSTQAAPSAAPASPGLAAGPIPEGFPLEEVLGQINGQQGGGAIMASSPQISASAIPLNYSGPLSGLLDIVSSHFNVAWKYERGRIVLDTVVTRSFDIPALAISADLSFELTSKSSQSGSGGSEGSAGQSATASAKSNVFDEIQAGIQGLVGEGSFSINKTTGVVTVTSTPAVVSRVADYVTSMNQRLAEQVAVSVKVYSVTLNDDEEFDLNVAGIFQQAGKYGLEIGNAVSSGGVVPSPAGGFGPGLGWALLDGSSKWAGSNALVRALATRGDVSVVTTASVTTVNGIPVPLQVGEQRDYVKSVSVTPGTDGAEPTASVESDTVSTGFSLQLTPRVERNGDILLQYGINISELTGAEDGFDTFTTMGSTVQLRRINQRNFIQQARIPNNNTLVLAGFEQVRNESVKRGVGRASFPLFGGGNKAAIKREIIVIAITPTLLKTN